MATRDGASTNWRELPKAMHDADSRVRSLPLNELRRAIVEQDLAEALELPRNLEALRPATPTHAPVEETVLAGKFVRHTGQLKSIVDVIRIVCANAESDLATLIAPHTGRPREAKKVIANLLAAPGRVTVTDHAIHIGCGSSASAES